jgi:stage III sporulation protein AF
MEWVNAWTKKIILLVLLAAFLDLVLPNTNLQRYVKMVMGLILLLTILSPVFAIFNLSQDELAFRLGQYQDDFQNAAKTDWQPLAKKLFGHQQEQVTSYVKQQMEEAIREQIKRDYGTEPETVEVVLNDTDPKNPAITRITVRLAEEGRESNAKQAVKPVEPVVIQIGNKQSSASSGKEAGAQRNPRDAGMAARLAELWNLQIEQVEVIRATDAWKE